MTRRRLADAVSDAVSAYADVLQDDIQIVVMQYAGREDGGGETPGSAVPATVPDGAASGEPED